MSPPRGGNRVLPAVRLEDRITQLDDATLYEFLHQDAVRRYDQEPKPLQLDTVVSLVKHKHTFLLAGTGFGKTHIAEMYHNLFKPSQKPMVMVVNFLDSLGDNQVRTHLIYLLLWVLLIIFGC